MLPEHSRTLVLPTANCPPVDRAEIVALQARKRLVGMYQVRHTAVAHPVGGVSRLSLAYMEAVVTIVV
jgi:hypothetical protein